MKWKDVRCEKLEGPEGKLLKVSEKVIIMGGGGGRMVYSLSFSLRLIEEFFGGKENSTF